MPFLILNDYFSSIQDANLQQILASNDSYRLTKEATALSEIISYLTQKYDVSQEFSETVAFSLSATYNATQLVYLDANAFDPTATYSLNALVLQTGNVYYCSTANGPGSFTIGDWTILGSQYAMFNIPLPYPEFNYQGNYVVGDIIFWRNIIYTCKQPSAVNTQQSDIQYHTIADIPITNQFPDTTNNTQWTAGPSYSFSGVWPNFNPSSYPAWSSVTTYTKCQFATLNSVTYQALKNNTDITPGTDITAWQSISWIAGDNRNPQLVELNVHIAIYKLSTRISPRNIPDIWVKNYDDAIHWLKLCSDGMVTLDCPEIQPYQGRRIRYGGQPKNINTY